MRFCLNCGAPLPDAPVVVNFGGTQGGQSSPGTNPYGQSMETKVNQPVFQQPPPAQNYSMVPPAAKSGGKKIWIVVAGVFVLLFLGAIGVVGIVILNMMREKDNVVVKTTPTPSASASPSPSPSASKSASPKATAEPTKAVNSEYQNVKTKFSKVWVEYNKTQDDEFGMIVHLKFEVNNMKDVDSFAIIYFQKPDGTFLQDGTGNYAAKDGRVAALKALRPGFEPTVYEDLEIFVPYDNLNLEVGKYNLKMDIDLVDQDENFIQHLTFKEFQYEQKL
jgi:hypothetical protein